MDSAWPECKHGELFLKGHVCRDRCCKVRVWGREGWGVGGCLGAAGQTGYRKTLQRWEKDSASVISGKWDTSVRWIPPPGVWSSARLGRLDETLKRINFVFAATSTNVDVMSSQKHAHGLKVHKDVDRKLVDKHIKAEWKGFIQKYEVHWIFLRVRKKRVY